MARRRARRGLSVLRATVAAALLASSLVAVGSTAAPAAAATVAPGTPHLVEHQLFDGAVFPPQDWTTPEGTWTQDCTPEAPAAGCAAVATLTDPTPGVRSQLVFDLPTGIPPDLQNATLTFSSTFEGGATSAGDSLAVWQEGPWANEPNHLEPVRSDLPGQQLHTVPLTSTKLPLYFRWTSFGDDTATTHKTWEIRDVKISGTISGATYALTANPIGNTDYVVTAGKPVTLTLSGSSVPDGAAMSFAVVDPPTAGTLGTIRQKDATSATVTYTGNPCPNVDGVATFICVETGLTYQAVDLSGNESAPAKVTLDVKPAGAGATTVTLDAPASAGYSTLTENGTQATVSDLSQQVRLGPADFPDAVQLNLRVATGELRLPALASSFATLVDGTSSPGAQIRLKGSVAKVNAAVSQLLYYPPAGTTPTTTLELSTFDLGATGQGPRVDGAAKTVTISPAAVVTKPVMSLPTGPLSVATGTVLSFPAGAATGLSVADAAANSTTLDTVLLSVNGGSLHLPANPSGVTVVSRSEGASLELTGTVADLNAALTGLTFDPGSSAGTITLTGSVQNPSGSSSDVRSVEITVLGAPYAFGVTQVSTQADVPLTVFLCGNAPAGAKLSFTVVGPPAHGSFVADPSADVAGSGCSTSGLVAGYRYTPTAGYAGTDRVTYTVDDATTGLSSSVNALDVTVLAHTTPIADPATASTRQDAPVDVTVCGYNPDPAPALTFTVRSAPSHGTVSDRGVPVVNTCGLAQTPRVLRYTPAAGSFTSDGVDSFTYVTSNGAVSAPATVRIAVATRTPQVVARSLVLDENTSIGFVLCASTPNGPVTFDLSTPAHGTVDTVLAPGTLPSCPEGTFVLGQRRYVPTPYYSGPDSFTYTATDGTYTSAPARIDVDVRFVAIPPTADAQRVDVLSPQPAAITLTGASVHDLPLTYRVVTPPTKGTLTGSAPSLVYTPHPTSSGADSFSFVANDGVLDSLPATVSIDVVRPSLSSSVCTLAVLPLGDGCAASLAVVPDGAGGSIALAHTPGTHLSRADLQVTVTNDTSVTDVVTLRVSAAELPWQARYAVGGRDVTDELTGAGYAVALPPRGSARVLLHVNTPLGYPSPPTVRIVVTGTSGNDPAVRTDLPVLVQNGKNAPSLSLAQADGTGATSGPLPLVTPPLYTGGPVRTVRMLAGVTGTGTGMFRIQATPQTPATGGIAARYFRHSTDVTAEVLAGTLLLQCYADIGCSPMRVELTPGTAAGNLRVDVTLTAAIDGSSSSASFHAAQTSQLGPDFYVSTPLGRVGQSVIEATPDTQVVSAPLAVSSTTSRRFSLFNRASVPDVLKVTVTSVVGDSTTAISGWPTGTTRAGDVWTVPLSGNEYADLTMTATSAAAVGSRPTSLVVTATSVLDPSRSDAFRITFPTYSFAPSITAPLADSLDVSSAPRTWELPLEEKGLGEAPQDAVVVRAPSSDASFVLRYSLRDAAGTRDVTTQVTSADGLPLTLAPKGRASQTLLMTVSTTTTARLGTPRQLSFSVTSVSALPSVVVGRATTTLLNAGDSRLLLAGMPQDEPRDIARRTYLEPRTVPIARGAWTADSVYGDHNDTAGRKAAYVSGLDVFALRIAANKVFAAPYRVVVSAPSGRALPLWMDQAFGGFTHNGVTQVPTDPLAAGGLDPTFTAGGVDVTAAVLGGTWTTASLRPGQSVDLNVSFAPPPGDSRRYRPVKVELVHATTGAVEDVFVLLPSTILGCSSDSVDQVRATSTSPSGSRHSLSFRAYDRTTTADTGSCMQRLSTGWITRKPLVLSSYQAARTTSAGDVPAGGDNPNGLWLVPQGGALIRVDARTLAITSDHVKAYVDTPFLGANGEPDPALDGMLSYTFVGDYPGLVWRTMDNRNGLRVPAATGLAPSPFPLLKPSLAMWPGNTMDAARYFQVRTDGTPMMVGVMAINTPWYQADVPLFTPVDNSTGISLAYSAPPEAVGRLPGDDSVTSYGMFWQTRKDGVVIQGGCLGLPPMFTDLLGQLPGYCLVGVLTTYFPIPRDPRITATIQKVDFGMRIVGIEVGTPEFNLKALSGGVTFQEVGSTAVKEVVMRADFGVGPQTPCSLDQKARKLAGTVATTTQEITDKLCPKNYFLYKTVVTFKQGGFTGASADSGVGVRFDGTLSLLGYVDLTRVVADVSTEPFNFHFANSPVAVSLNVGIPVSADITLDGNIGATGFDIGLSGTLSVYGETIASASGVLSSKGFGVCGGLGGVSVGIGDIWGEPPVFYPSNCTTTQYKVNS